jgi:hypothetical protein
MRWLLGSMMVALLGAGCDAPGSDEPSGPPGESGAEETKLVAVAPLIDRQVTWPARERLESDVLAGLTATAARVVPSSTLPVLVPRQPELLAAAVLMVRPRWYALSTRSSGLTVSLHASGSAHRYPHIGALGGNRALRGSAGFVGHNRGIWSATWVENGVAYALDVECAALPDPRCEDETELLALVEGLAYVGGAGAEEGQP